MKRALYYIVSAIFIAGLAFSLSDKQKVGATVPGANYLVSSDTSGNFANGNSMVGQHAISGDGRYVAFISNASNLVPNDTNGKPDIFVKDAQTGNVTLVDVDGAGAEASLGAGRPNMDLTVTPAISYDGRYVVFFSSSNLVSGYTGATIYRRDLVNNVTTVVSATATGTTMAGLNPDINADGRYVVYAVHSTGTNTQVVDIKDMQNGTLQTIAQGSYDSGYPSIDCDGHVVSFSSATNLGGGTPSGSDGYNTQFNYYFRVIDWSTNPLTYMSDESLINRGMGGWPSQVSCDGNFVIQGDSLVVNRLTGQTINLDPTDNARTTKPQFGSLSNDGRYAVFTTKGTNVDATYASTNRSTLFDIFLRDTRNNTTQLLSFTVSGYMSGRVEGQEVSISPDGSTAAYTYNTPSTSGTGGELISGVDTGVQDVYTSKTGF
jgi:Tol biopolymer transport system component